jgi:hypothetical protein
MTLRDFLPWAFWILTAVALAWDMLVAARTTRVRQAPPAYRSLTSLAGLLIVPGVVVAITASSNLTARAIHAVSWIWPLALLVCAAQAWYVVARRLVSPFIALPVALYDATLALVALTRWLVSIGSDPGEGALVMSAAESSALGILLGRSAFWSPFAIPLPFLLPAAPARWRASAAARWLVAITAATSFVLVLGDAPRSWYALRSYAVFGRARLQERPAGDFRIGLRLLPTLRGAPPRQALEQDLRLLDSLDARAALVVIGPEITRRAALDSIGRVAERLRRDSVLVIVALGMPLDAAVRYRRDPEAFRRALADDARRVTRRLRPDILLPVRDPNGAGRRALGRVPGAWWRDYLRLAAREVRLERPRTRVAVSLGAFTDADSALYAWATAEGSPLDVVGFEVLPSYGGGESLAARLRTADRWMRSSAKEHWIFAAGGFPLAHGEANQSRAIWGALAWGTSHPRVRGVIVEGAGDYDALTGLRAASGRVRPAAAFVARAVAVLAESEQ